MEIILAIMVASAVILFGALLSMGNERQRKAIEDLREQVFQWAVKDLMIKREHLANTVDVPDPLVWLNICASRISGYDLNLRLVKVCEKPQALICTSVDGVTQIIFSPLSPAELRRIRTGKQNRLSKFADQNPLLFLPRHVNVHEMSVLNAGHLFDLELTRVWMALTGMQLESTTRFWMYEY